MNECNILGFTINDLHELVNILPGGPCEGLHISEGDVLINIDGNILNGKSNEDIKNACNGDFKSPAILTLQRDWPFSPFRYEQEWQVSVPRVRYQESEHQVKAGLNRRDPKTVKEVFDKFFEIQLKGLSKRSLLLALKQFGVSVDVSDEMMVNEIFQKYDSNGDGTIDLEEFKLALENAVPEPDWIKAIPIQEILVDCLPRSRSGNAIVNPNEWTEAEIEASIKAMKMGLKEAMTKLQNAFKKVDEDDLKNPKGGQRLICGDIKDFHQGLTARIGHPNLQFMHSMKTEHTKEDHQFPFETTNTNISTTPKREWNLVVNDWDPIQQDDWTRNMSSAEGANDRNIKPLAELMALQETLNARLIKAEVVSVVLYTGPMYIVFNSILRGIGEYFTICDEKRNLFSTSIHVLASAIKKLSHVTKLHPGMALYRGLGNNTGLPDCAFKVDEYGCRGFTELSFMSTTSNKEVAVQYALRDKASTSPKVLELRCWSVDRGACIKAYSQYAHEVEYLFVPYSFVQVLGPKLREVTSEGKEVTVISVMVDSNQQVQTVDQLREEKRGLHVSAFTQLVNDVDAELMRLEEIWKEKDRLVRDELRGKRTMEGFRRRIVQDCRVVLGKHKTVATRHYASSESYRKMVLEMLDVGEMAVSKFREWLDNEESSSLLFRFACPLRTAQRRRISYLESELKVPGIDTVRKQKLALTLCRLTNLVTDHVEETNELQETRIMAAAAEGLSVRALKLLCLAGANVHAARPDGVTAMWLAAQFGHVDCIGFLHGEGADVNAPANDGATPAYTAAQSGHSECIQRLFEFKAVLDRGDKIGKTPLFQADKNKHKDCKDLLLKLLGQGGQQSSDTSAEAAAAKHAQSSEPADLKGDSSGERRLIISSGDLADVDGFLALAEYAKTGADVLFILNFPGYLAVIDRESVHDDRDVVSVRVQLEDYGERSLEHLDEGELEDLLYAYENPGLGFRYGADQMAWRLKDVNFDDESAYLALMAERGARPGDQCAQVRKAMRKALMDVAISIVKGVWEDREERAESGGSARGSLYLGIGGINAVNPFSRSKVKNEPLLYATLLQGRWKLTKDLSDKNPEPKCGDVFNLRAEKQDNFNLSGYTQVFMDFCGPVAYWDEGWDQLVRNLVHVSSQQSPTMTPTLRGVFVMGGVWADTEPVTQPPNRGVLNRLSSATMNQLYHPHATGRFFSFLDEFDVPTFVVTNNEVVTIDDRSTDSSRSVADAKAPGRMDSVRRFLINNKLGGTFVEKLATTYYGNSRHAPVLKPYDLYVARALANHLRDLAEGRSGVTVLTASKAGHLFWCTTYGTTLVSGKAEWVQAKQQYIKSVQHKNKKEKAVESAQTNQECTKSVLELRAVKEDVVRARRQELDVVREMYQEASVAVKLVHFKMEESLIIVVTAEPPENKTT